MILNIRSSALLCVIPPSACGRSSLQLVMLTNGRILVPTNYRKLKSFSGELHTKIPLLNSLNTKHLLYPRYPPHSYCSQARHQFLESTIVRCSINLRIPKVGNDIAPNSLGVLVMPIPIQLLEVLGCHYNTVERAAHVVTGANQKHRV